MFPPGALLRLGLAIVAIDAEPWLIMDIPVIRCPQAIGDLPKALAVLVRIRPLLYVHPGAYIATPRATRAPPDEYAYASPIGSVWKSV